MLDSRTRVALLVLIVASRAVSLFAAEEQPKPPDVWARVQMLEPANQPWSLHIIVHPAHLKQTDILVGETVAEKAADLKPIAAAARSPWVNLTAALGKGTNSVRFLFEPKDAFAGAGVKASFSFATAAEDAAIARTITDHDTGNVISFRVPQDLVKDKQGLLSIREDTERRLREVKALNLPKGPLPQKIWCITGFRSNGQFYTDPAIAEMDFDIIRTLGMNGFWEQNGGQPGALQKMAAARGIDRTTVYWRAVESPPRDAELGGVRLDWAKLGAFMDDVYRRGIEGTRKAHPGGLPTTIADLMDEPAGQGFAGPEYQNEFHLYLQQHGLTPDFLGKKTWDEVQAPTFNWWTYFKTRDALDLKDLNVRRSWYWATRFWNHATARLYAMATRAVEKYAPGVGTRVNFGPPWWYDYGSLPRGIDAFEFGRLRGVSLNFNEDWVGNGNPRWPLEINTFLMDWGRGALRPQRPTSGCYITRDANRTAVKLRAFGALARECKIFDFYYYGPAYTFFDHWSDNASMVQGVGELTRDMGAVDDILWDGKAPAADVALLCSKSWPVWKQDDTEQAELMMVYLALLHAGIPVDIVSDEEVADGRFAAHGYKCLYVVNESIPAAAQEAIRRWVADGGRLWLEGWAGMRDEYNTPTDAWNEMLGVKQRSWEPTGDLARFGQEIKVDDWMRPLFGRACVFAPREGVEMPVATFSTEEGIETTRIRVPSGPYSLPAGKGTVHVVPSTAGKSYLDAHQKVDGQLAPAILYPDGKEREAIVRPALDSGVRPAATTSVSQILAWPLWTQHKGVVLIANFTGNPAEAVEVGFLLPRPVRAVRSLRHGDLKFDEATRCTLPVNEVTDILVVE